MIARRGLAAIALALPALASAQTTRPLRIVVPYPAGGPTDLLGRLAARELSEALGQPAAVENIPGASGTIGARAVARAAPDGRMLVLGNSQSHATAVAMVTHLPYDPVKDFSAVAGLVDLQHALVVTPAIPARTATELIAFMRGRGDALNYGSTGVGSLSHLGMALFRAHAASSMTHVPFPRRLPSGGSRRWTAARRPSPTAS
jgi:tripartite-type tricarboxylate transporter receptor subunit TctC